MGETGNLGIGLDLFLILNFMFCLLADEQAVIRKVDQGTYICFVSILLTTKSSPIFVLYIVIC